MTHFDPIEYINEPRWRHSSLGLERISLLLEKLGNPQSRLRAVHVAGTNGKGSTCAYLASILRCAGLRCGLFTSPYIERFEERIKVDGEAISMEDLTSATLEVRAAADEVESELGEHPTEFELMCAVGLMYFARTECDVAVIECGLGGRLDATNVVIPIASVITRIGLDHTDILGDTIGLIAAEKAGIVKPGVPVVSAHQLPEAADVIRATCEDLRCRLVVSDQSAIRESRIEANGSGAPAFRVFEYRGERFETSLLAAYQPENAAVAIDTAKLLTDVHPELGIDESVIRHGIASARWPGRFEVASAHPLVLVDGAHNPDGASALALSAEELLSALGKGRAATLVIGVLADKDWHGIVAPMLPYAHRVIAYSPDNPRALAASELASYVKAQTQKQGCPHGDALAQVNSAVQSLTQAESSAIEVIEASSASEAMRAAMREEGPEGTVIAFGTLYSIGSLKEAVRGYSSSLGVSTP